MLVHTQTGTLDTGSEGLRARFRLKEDNANLKICTTLATEAALEAKPKVAWCETEVEKLDQKGMTLSGIRFASTLFHLHLQEGQRVYPFVATCGREIETWSAQYSGDLLRMYWADAIMEYAAEQARELLRDKFRQETALALSEYSPGSLPEFPISEQKPLFQLLGDAVAEIGVALNDSFLMLPIKSVSGILFYGETAFHSCQMCPRLDCPKRRTD